ncbi:Glyoxalase-like domain containing protein [Trema orientale]|uniref:Glyoxalase-like domain containing protein n=1 Tax=Trema orientale TaxID=63057 RepID=A0A2P5CY44_TREOI|nr:Glyoxalase-like domain containing protein [Trema orientale]
MAQQEVQNGGAEKVAAEGVATVAFTAVKPQLLVEAPKANDAVLFYKAAFGAEEVGRTVYPKRKAEQENPLILSAELKLAGSTIIVSDHADDSAAPAKSTGSGGVVLCLETEDVGAAIAKAVSAGGVAEGEIVEGDGACCGGSVGKVKDPYGYVWLICSPGNKCAVPEA